MYCAPNERPITFVEILSTFCNLWQADRKCGKRQCQYIANSCCNQVTDWFYFMWQRKAGLAQIGVFKMFTTQKGFDKVIAEIKWRTY